MSLDPTLEADAEPPHQGCRAFMRLGVPQGTVHRFVVGRDAKSVPLSADDIRGKLFDPFAQRLLAEGNLPETAGGLVDDFKQAVGADDPGARERSFLVGEGSQVPLGKLEFGGRTMRFVIALGDADAALLLVSASSPGSTSIEVMAWDERVGGFNYYRTSRDGGWLFAGNSADALREDTEGNGPFESHTAGNFLMKELRFPWVHWHSPIPGAAAVDPAIFDGEPDLAGHRWLRPDGEGGGTLAGADVCETQVAMPSVERWTKVLFDAIRSGREPLRPKRIMSHVLTSPTVNLVSSPTKSADAQAGTEIELPPQFFADHETLSGFLGLEPVPALHVPAEDYLAVMKEFDVRLEIDDPDLQFRQDGDTHFAFVVPERAFEDIEIVKAATDMLLTRRMAACLLMVDFPNPVFSPRRSALLEKVTWDMDLAAGPEAISEALAERIRANAAEGSPEQEFARLWELGEDWQTGCNELLTAYYAKLTERLADQPGAAFRDWFRLAESVRRQAAVVKKMPIFEFPLLLPVSNAEAEDLAMRADGTVGAPA